MATNTLQKTELTIDYPQASETIVSTNYTLRLDGGPAAAVQVSIDDGPWTDCRRDVGYWWFDWCGYETGRHEVKAQALSADGRVTAVESRQVLVRLEGDEPSPRRHRRGN